MQKIRSESRRCYVESDRHLLGRRQPSLTFPARKLTLLRPTPLPDRRSEIDDRRRVPARPGAQVALDLQRAGSSATISSGRPSNHRERGRRNFRSRRARHFVKTERPSIKASVDRANRTRDQRRQRNPGRRRTVFPESRAGRLRRRLESRYRCAEPTTRGRRTQCSRVHRG